MSADEVAFLRAIAAEPEDDLPRLVYADWLDDRGDPRGEYIRVAVELERTTTEALVARERTLRAQHGATWQLPHEFDDQIFRRGFVETLVVSRTQAANLPAIDPTTSTILALVLAHELDEYDVANIAANDFGRRIWRLTVFDPNDQLGPLVTDACPNLRGLEVVRPEGFGQLADLGFLYGPTGDAVAETVASAATLAGLEWLALVGHAEEDFSTRIHAAAAGDIARSRFLTNLKHLVLSHNAIGDGGLASLAMSGNCASLETLDLTDNDIGESEDVAVERLCESPYFDSLTHLDLRMNPIGYEARRLLRRRFGDVVLM